MEDCDLYQDYMKSEHPEYDNRQVKDKLAKYRNYLNGVIKHYRENPITFDCRFPTPSKPKSSPAKQQKPADDSDAWILLDKLDDETLRQAMDEDHTKRVLELEEEPDAGKKPGTKPRIEIIGRDPDKKRILLERLPRTKTLGIEQNIHPIKKQRNAIESLMFRPSPEHFTLLKLFHNRDDVELEGDWEPEVVKRWFILDDREGADQQKTFVRKALATPDFAFLEGPPGSGKTTALCELVHQLVHQGKRVLFCASTHIAVDNLLEKITDKYTNEPADSNIIPLRIGKSEKIPPSTKGYVYDNVIERIREKITNHLEGVSSRNTEQDLLYDQIQSDDTIGQIARDCANLVCGTTIGILQHPDIKNHSDDAMFDVMIIDEASKTTFQEFLVPALHTRRWIVVGDTRQLAPHTSQEEVKMHVDQCIDDIVGQACCDVFLAHNRGITTIVATDSTDAKECYRLQCSKLGVSMQDADSDRPAWSRGGIILGTCRSLARLDAKLLQGADNRRMVVRGLNGILGELKKEKDVDKAKIQLWKKFRYMRGKRSYEDTEWGDQATWRIMSSPIGGGNAGSGQERIAEEIKMLMPADENQRHDVDKRLDEVKKIALPSILQLLQYGYGSGEDTIMTKGIPKDEFEKRHVLLKWQHRMHDEIAEFPRTHVYDGNALLTPETTRTARSWKYDGYGSRFVWIDAKDSRRYSSDTEAGIICAELEKFYGFARKNRRKDGMPWEVAILTFYTRQQQTVLSHLARMCGKAGQRQFCMRDGKDDIVDIQCQTLDSFQGHEADIVFLSIASNHPTAFLENPNRINVAITRARYQNVIVGDRLAMGKSSSLLGLLAQDIRLHGGDSR